ncbi:hypothetical protein WA026_020238 [Henosepilachna vigintioctopunctata]|uniref:PHD-type domain-containing protein n=1 Tax=Henosepilachna vigintioctopunctata TaxID=420089 RepID=A0AAW1TPX8_9CUCU
MDKNGDDACRKCGKNFSNRDYSLKCNGECSGWFHKKCTGLTNEDVKAVEKGRNHFVCEACRSKVMSDFSVNELLVGNEVQKNFEIVIQLLKVVVTKCEKLENENSEIKRTMKELVLKMSSIPENTLQGLKKTENGTVLNEAKGRRSYADSLKNVNNVIVIRPKKQQQSEITREELKK